MKKTAVTQPCLNCGAAMTERREAVAPMRGSRAEPVRMTFWFNGDTWEPSETAPHAVRRTPKTMREVTA